MFLKKIRVTSNASRNLYKISSSWWDKGTTKKLDFRRFSLAGRASHGRIVVYSKSSLLKKIRKPRINYNFRLKILTFVSTLKLIPFENKLVALLHTFTKGLTYIQVSDAINVFDMMYFPYTNPKWKRHFRNPKLFLLCYIRKLTKVSLLELFPGAGIKFVRSAGTCAKIIRFDHSSHNALLKLPSGVKKLFSLYSLVTLGPVALQFKRNWANTKSGYWRTFGSKPRVRGVARNPVDHPHGGRTKSVKYPRTPWGKTTKKK